MAIAHDYASESHTGTTGSQSETSFSWTHSGAASGVQGAVVFTFTNTSTIFVSGVTYGGLTLTEVTSATAVDSAGEPGVCRAWFVGSGIPQGNQSVVVSRTQNAQIIYATCATMTGSGITKVIGAPVLVKNDAAQSEQSIDTQGRYAIRYAGTTSGLATPPGAGASSTSLHVIDYSSLGNTFVRETTPGTGNRAVGFTGASDDVAAVYIAITEINAEVSSVDKTFLEELRGNALEKQLGDKVFTTEKLLFKTRDLKYLPDRLFLNENVTILAPTGAIERGDIDRLFLRSARQSDRAFRVVDPTLVRSQRLSDRSSLQQDSTLLRTQRTGDLSSLQRDSPLLRTQRTSERERSVRDAALLGTNRFSDRLLQYPTIWLLLGDRVEAGLGVVNRSAIDALFTPDSRVSDRALLSLDKLFNRDPVLTSVMHGLVLLDAALLRDVTIRGIDATQRDSLLLMVRRYGDLTKLVFEAVLLKDTVSTLVESSGVTRSAVDKLFLRDPALRFAHDIRYPDPTFLKDAVTTLVEGAAGIRTALDKLFIRDKPLSKDHDLAATLDSLWFSDSVSLLITAAAQTRSALDKLFVRDAVQRDQLMVRVDKLFADDPVKREQLLNRMDRLFTRDAPASDVIRIRSALDALLARDEVSRDQLLVQVDKLLMQDALVSDAAQTRSVADRLFVYDVVRREQLLTQVEKLFTQDARVSDVAHFFADRLLLPDSRFHIAELRAIEGVLLADVVLRALERVQREGLLLRDSQDLVKTGEIIRYALDALLLYDSVRKSPEFVTQREGVLLTDSRFSQLARALLDSLFVAESRVSALERAHTDKLFAYDTVATEKLAGLLHLITDRDNALLRDGVLRLQQQQQRDTALLNDAGALGKDVARATAEGMFLLDRRAQSGREINRLETVALHVLASQVRELLVDEGLYATDSVAAQWFPVIVEIMTYVRLATSDVLGTRVLAVDPLGRRCSVTQWRLG